MIEAVAYAYDNLLAHSESPNSSGPTSERLLQYFAQYISWALDVFRSIDGFIKLLTSNSDFAAALIVSCSPALMPPWVMDLITGAPKSGAAGTESEKIILDTTDSKHILYRKCSCGYQGVMGIQCRSCNMFDGQVGTSVEFYGSLLGSVGASRISGEQTNFQYTCKSCQKSGTYNTDTHSFYNNLNKRNHLSAQMCLGYLWCPKCHSRGYNTGNHIISFV